MNVYKQLLDKAKNNLDEKDKLAIQFNIMNIFIRESMDNKAFVEKYECTKKQVKQSIDGFSQKWEKLSDTKKALFEQATETYRPSLCDSSCYGTMNNYYLNQIETLFNGELYLLDSDGCIHPILWNLNEYYKGGYSLEIDREKTNDLLNFSNSENLKRESWNVCIDKYIENKELEDEWSIYQKNRNNTYNYGGYFTILYRTWFIGDECYYVIRIHIGADIRGGYSNPYIYHFGNIRDWECSHPTILGTYESLNFWCKKCNKSYWYYNDDDKFYFDKEDKVYRCGNIVKQEIPNQKTLDGKQATKKVKCGNELSISFI